MASVGIPALCLISILTGAVGTDPCVDVRQHPDLPLGELGDGFGKVGPLGELVDPLAADAEQAADLVGSDEAMWSRRHAHDYRRMTRDGRAGLVFRWDDRRGCPPASILSVGPMRYFAGSAQSGRGRYAVRCHWDSSAAAVRGLGEPGRYRRHRNADQPDEAPPAGEERNGWPDLRVLIIGSAEGAQ